MLENLIKLELDKYKNNSYLTHNFHPYPAKYIPQIPAEIIRGLSKEGEWILDPFCGSGTTLVESKLLGRNSVGIDVNPLACLISEVKILELSDEEIAVIHNFLSVIDIEIKDKKKYPKPIHTNLNLWFEPFIQDELAVVRANIDNITCGKVAKFLKVALSSIIVKVSNQDSDTRYKAVKKDLKEGDVLKHLVIRIYDMLKRLHQFNCLSKKAFTQVINSDSTDFKWSGSLFNLAVTSPPYLNSYDYYLYHKHRMAWLDLDYKTTQEKEFGSRNKHNDRGLGLEDYNNSIKNNALIIKNLLKKDGYYCIIVGDGILKGNLIKMNKNFDDIYQSIGYKKVYEFTFDQRKYTRTFTPKLKTEFKESYLLIYQNI